MSRQVGVCIVGMGIGRENAKGFLADKRSRIVALCDVVQAKMDACARELGGEVKTYTDYRRMCRDREIDAVFVGTPNQWHVPIAVEAMRRDKHVMVTKPLADSARAAARAVEVAEKSGVVNMMSLSTRFSDRVQCLGRQVRGGTFGELYYGRARSIRRSGIPDWSEGFILAGGGAFRDMGVHVLDAAWWLLGMPRPLSATGVGGAKFGPFGKGWWDFHKPPKFYKRYAADDYAGGFIRFEGGSALTVESFWACHQAPDFQIELFGTEAGAKLQPLTVYRTVDGAPNDTTVEMPRGLPSGWNVMASHFLDCILRGSQCSAPLRHGLVVQQMMEAVLKSAQTGREVRLA